MVQWSNRRNGELQKHNKDICLPDLEGARKKVGESLVNSGGRGKESTHGSIVNFPSMRVYNQSLKLRQKVWSISYFCGTSGIPFTKPSATVSISVYNDLEK